MTIAEIKQRLREIREERNDLKQQVRDYEPDLEDIRHFMEQHPKRQMQDQYEIQLNILRNEAGDLKDALKALRDK